MSGLEDAFIKPRLSPSLLDTYTVRKALLDAVRQGCSQFSGTLLDVGCGRMPYRDLILATGKVERYLGLELAGSTIYPQQGELVWDGSSIPLPDAAVECAMATEVLEHCPEPAGVLAEVFRVLKPGGTLFFTVPFLWPLHDVPFDQYRYTPFCLERLLGEAGFQRVRLEPLGGWNESLAQMIGLFVRRRPMPPLVRTALSLAACPVVYWLTRPWTRAPGGERFAESSMITGLWGLACKPNHGPAGAVGSAAPGTEPPPWEQGRL